MPNLSELKAQLGILRQSWKLIPAPSEVEAYRRECEENIVLLQIEAENLRTSFKREILLAKKVYIEKKDETIVRTAFGWESVRDTFIAGINDREIKGLAYYENEILKSYATEQQSSQQASGVPAVNQ